MRLLWTAGDRMILFGFGREKLPEMNGLYLIAKPVRRGGRKLCPVVTCREARQGGSYCLSITNLAVSRLRCSTKIGLSAVSRSITSSV